MFIFCLHVNNLFTLIFQYCPSFNFLVCRAETRERDRRERNRKLKRYALIGTAGTIGGVLIGLTGGLAAPLFAAGAGVFIGAGAAAGIATTAGAAVLGSLFGVAGAGFAGYKMKKRVGAIEEFVIETLTEAGPSLHVVVAVSGWIAEDREGNSFGKNTV